jgi:uncharacterized protein (UPF0276 family)
VGLRDIHYDYVLENKPDVDWFEIISENFMVDGGRSLEVLDQIVEHYPVIQHGVALYFGSLDAYDKLHLKKLKALVKRTGTPFLSDHLCWGSINGKFTHDLLPLPYTFEAANNCAARIKYVRDYLEIPVCVENVSSYAEFCASEMTEWQFLSEVTELADCGILLDVNNVYVSSQNHDFDPYDYIDNIPHERIGQIHVAGHTRLDKVILDTHDHSVCAPVWDLYRHVIKTLGTTNTLLEWDAQLPAFSDLHAEALKARDFQGDTNYEEQQTATRYDIRNKH